MNKFRLRSSEAARVLALAGLWLAAASGPAVAVDGVIEINQARAVAGGVTATDSAGFPVTLDAGGSYRLTTDLEVPDANTTYGLNLAGNGGVDGYGGNSISSNNGGNANAQISGGTQIGTNVCGTNTTCP